ncbi:PP2C family protein-serine/threonine phosphatase [Stratiformator vulcanicus]|uniref:Phosphoserine phosphatase RsbU n=1 Tax=Stratiformator vulcanicus TaxID=2527980 RepID=A0A517R5R2_9PLAN|nr:fused response regulator/phosphatase [Stratiformator vulcanicus]QDT39175.1 Phosphoserine phosphatase RsbU [Stratiformator vulcanicus]
MRILVGWDNAEQAELVGQFLNIDEQSADVVIGPEPFAAKIDAEQWPYDAVLMTLTLPDHESASVLFTRLRQRFPRCPVIAACSSEEVYRLAGYLRHGLRSYVLRDFGGDFIFLLKTTLQSTLEAVQAEVAQQASEQMRAEIDAAHRFQQSVIPKFLPQPDGYEIAARYEPAEIRVEGTSHIRLAGGDYYDAWQMQIPGQMPFSRTKATCLLLADAAGHGMRACLSITALDAVMRFTAPRLHRDPGSLMGSLNRSYCRQRVNQHGGSLVTAVYAVLDASKHRVTWTSAGHPLPLLHDVKRGKVGSLRKAGPNSSPLGTDRDSIYQKNVAELPRDGRLLLYTDGLTEAGPPDRKQDQFGTDGISKVLRETTEASPAETLEALFKAASDFTEGAGRDDDTSALLIARKD